MYRILSAPLSRDKISGKFDSVLRHHVEGFVSLSLPQLRSVKVVGQVDGRGTKQRTVRDDLDLGLAHWSWFQCPLSLLSSSTNKNRTLNITL